MLLNNFETLPNKSSNKLCCFPKNIKGKICGYDNDHLQMPNKIIEMGLLPETSFVILHQAPFRGPLYIEYGEEKTRVALREEEARYIFVEPEK